MEKLLDELRAFITKKSASPTFVHHKWFIKWHLEIVETLSKDMMNIIPRPTKPHLSH